MLGRASYMRLPDIIGVNLKGQRSPALLQQISFLHSQSSCENNAWFSSYLEFFGEGADALTLVTEPRFPT